MVAGFRERVDATTVADLRARGSFKWTSPGADGFGAAVAEMDFGAAPAIVDELARWSAGELFGYLPQRLEDELARATADFVSRRYGWSVDPALVHPLPDVLAGLGVAIRHFSRPGSPVIVPTPAYMPFLIVPGLLGREIIQVPMADRDGRYEHDLAGIDAAFRAGGHLLVLTNPHNPLGRVFDRNELGEVTAVVDRHGGRVFSDEIHAPLVYPGVEHVPYASTSDVAAGHTLTAMSASKAWNVAGLKCAQLILSNDRDVARWAELGPLASEGVSNPGVVATVAAYRHGVDWLDDAIAYLDANRTLVADHLRDRLPRVAFRKPQATYLAWLDCSALDLPGPPGALVSERSKVLVVDGPEFGRGAEHAFRFNFATPAPILLDLLDRVTAALA